MKTLIVFVLGVVIGIFGFRSNILADVQITHNASGEKVVVITSDTLRNATIEAGRACAKGYTVLGHGAEDNKIVLTISCPEEKGFSFL